MESPRAGKSGTFFKRLVVVKNIFTIVLCFLCFPILGFADEIQEEIDIRLSEPRIKRTQRLTVSMIVDHSQVSEIVVKKPVFPEILSLLSGPIIKPMLLENGSQGAEITFVFSGRTSGRAILDPFIVEIPGKEYVTPRKIVEVSYREDLSKVSLNFQWYAKKNVVYVGEAIPVTLFAELADRIGLPEQIFVSPPVNGLFEKVPPVEVIREVTVDGRQFYTIPLESYMLTSAQAGNVLIQGGTVNAFGISENAQPLRLSVLPLPDTVSESAAIGDFRYSAEVEKLKIDKNETAAVLLRVSGAGNLHYLQFPEFLPDDMILVNKSEVSEYRAGKRGYEGFRELRLEFAPTRDGSILLELPGFVWFDPEQQESFRSTSKNITLDVSHPGNIGTTTMLTANKGLLTHQEIVQLQPADFMKKHYMYFFLVPGIVCILLGVLKRRKLLFFSAVFICFGLFLSAGIAENELSMIDGANELFYTGDLEGARDLYMENWSTISSYAGVRYNKAMIDLSLNNVLEAQYHARQAVRIAPANALFRSFLQKIYESGGFEHQHEIPAKLDADILFIAFLLSFTLLGFLIMSYFFWPKGVFVPFIVLSFLLTILFAGSSAYGILMVEKDLAVINTSDNGLRKIPVENAEPWMEIPAGTTVIIEAVSESFYLVSTSYDVQGWLPASAIRKFE